MNTRGVVWSCEGAVLLCERCERVVDGHQPARTPPIGVALASSATRIITTYRPILAVVPYAVPEWCK